MKRVLLIVFGVIFGLVGLGVLGVGAVMLAIFGPDGKATIPLGTVRAEQGRAIVVTSFEVSTTPVSIDPSVFEAKILATGPRPLFAGVAQREDALKYLQGVPYELVSGIDSSEDQLTATSIPGDRNPPPPQDAGIWTQQSGGDPATVDLLTTGSGSTLVLMNESGQPGVKANLSVLVAMSWAGPAAIGLTVLGLLLIVIGIVLLIMAFRSKGKPGPPSAGTVPPAAGAVPPAPGSSLPAPTGTPSGPSVVAEPTPAPPPTPPAPDAGTAAPGGDTAAGDATPDK